MSPTIGLISMRCDLCHSEDRHGALLCTTCAEAIGRLKVIRSIVEAPPDKPTREFRKLHRVVTGTTYLGPVAKSASASATSFNTADFDDGDAGEMNERL